MKKLVVLKLDGTFQDGFHVTLEVGEDEKRPFIELGGKLPIDLSIPKIYEQWQRSYWQLDGNSRIKLMQGQPTNVSFVDLQQTCQQTAQELIQHFNDWLKSNPFLPIRETCIEQFSTAEQIRVIIRSNCPLIQRLPWHRWDLAERYDTVAIALSSPESESPQRAPSSVKSTQVRILAILGNSRGIDIQRDRQLLENLPGAAVTFLVEPSRKEINDRLWEQPWDIFFFAGHSDSQQQTGRIYINTEDDLTIEDLKYGLAKTIKQGLQLAIFNSCDGLGLAQALESLHIPQVIVMGEPVPDRVAQEFLKHFLSAFAKGQTLYLAMREARERLHGDGLESQYPCASWLPILVQNPALFPPTWQTLRYGSGSVQRIRLLQSALTMSLGIAVIVMGMRFLGVLQSLELQAYDQMVRLRPDEGPDQRLLVIEITEADLQYQQQQGMKRQGSLSDLALSQLLSNLAPHHPSTIGLDIYRDFSVAKNVPTLATQLQKTHSFFSVCKTDDPTVGDVGIKPPPELPKSQLGFSDIVQDSDDVLRRHLFYMTPNLNTPCPTEMALSLQLAWHYLQTKGIAAAPIVTPEGNIQLGKTIIPMIQSHWGGYQGLDPKGAQTLLNYRNRSNIAPSLTLTQILKGDFDPHLIQDRVILIGGTKTSDNEDTLLTPLNSDASQKLPGVFVQAQMVSQILSAVLEGRSLLSVWNPWQETVWVLVWSTLGALLSWRTVRLSWLVLGGAIASFSLSSLCYGFFLMGWWVPLIPALIGFILAAGTISIARRTLPPLQEVHS